MGGGGQRSFLDQSTPCNVAGVLWNSRRQKLGTHSRADAVGSDQQFSFRLFAVREVGAYAARQILHARERCIGVIKLVGKLSLQNGIETAPRGEQLRQGQPP